MIPTETGTYTAEYTNTCSCEVYDPDTDESTPADYCYGDCWDTTVEDFGNITGHLFTETHQAFTISGFPTWRGPVDGMCTARDADDLLQAMTPDRAEWRMDVTVHADHIVARLYHHDAPTGGTMIVAPVVETR